MESIINYLRWETTMELPEICQFYQHAYRTLLGNMEQGAVPLDLGDMKRWERSRYQRDTWHYTGQYKYYVGEDDYLRAQQDLAALLVLMLLRYDDDETIRDYAREGGIEYGYILARRGYHDMDELVNYFRDKYTDEFREIILEHEGRGYDTSCSRMISSCS